MADLTAPHEPLSESVSKDANSISETVEYELVPHTDRLIINTPPNSAHQILTDRITLSQQQLPPGSWDLVFDDGFAALIKKNANDTDEPLLIENFMRRQLWQCSNGKLWIKDARDASDPTRKPWCLTDKLAGFMACDLTLHCQPLYAQCAMPGFILQWPRACGMKYLWSCMGLYKLLQLKSYGGEASRWVYRSSPKWLNFFKECDAGDQYFPSCRADDNGQKNDVVSHALPQPSLSSFGLVALLARWYTPGRGALSSLASRVAAKTCLQSLVDGAAPYGPFDIDVRFDNNWSPIWPALEEMSADCQLRVSTKGMVDCGPLLLKDKDPIVLQWSPLFEELVDELSHVHLATLLLMTCGKACAQGLYLQLLWRFSRHLEFSCLKSERKGRPCIEALGCAPSNIMDDFWDPARLDAHLARYVLSGVESTQGAKAISWASDKANVCSVTLSQGIVAMPSNFAAVLVPQVAAAFRSADDEKCDVAARGNLRQRLWLGRITTKRGGGAWRPRQVYRSSAEKWCAQQDNHLRASTDLKGLVFLQPCRGQLWADSNWKAWPTGSVGLDQGGDGLAGGYALQYKPDLALNLITFFEFSHGVKRDLLLTYKALRKYDFVVLLLLCYNLPHGPDKDEGLRYSQMMEALEHMVTHYKPNNFKLFEARAPAMLQQMGHLFEIDPGLGPLESLWNYIKTLVGGMRMGQRCRLCEYAGWFRRSREFLSIWSFRLFICEYIALEMDMLGGTKVLPHVAVNKAHLEHADTVQTTSKSVTQLDAKILRSACANNLVTNVAILTHDPYRRQLACMVEFPEPVIDSQSEAVKSCLDTQSSQQWLLKNMKDDFMQPQKAVFQKLGDVSSLRSCGFFEFQQTAGSANDLELAVHIDDEFADLCGKEVLALVACRQRRLLYLTHGWPHRQFKSLLGQTEAESVAADFKEYHKAYLWMTAVEGPGQQLVAMQHRHQCCTTPVRQLVAGYIESNYRPSEDIDTLADTRSKAVISSDICEHMHNAAKNAHQLRGGKRFRRPERAMAVTIGANILSERFAYKALQPTVPLSQKSARLSPAAFGKKPTEPSINLKGIASTSVKAAWFSPQAENTGLPCADVPVIQVAFKLNQPMIIERAVLGCFCDHMVPIIFRRSAGAAEGPLDWHIGLTNFWQSGALAWPVSLKPVPHHAANSYVDFDLKAKALTLVSFSSWDHVLAIPIRWRSWAWQWRHLPRARGVLAPAIRPFACGSEKPLLHVAADAGWWHWDVPTLKTLAPYLKLNVASDDSTLSVACSMTKQALPGCTSAQALENAAPRLAGGLPDPECLSILLEVDEAAKCLEREDERELNGERRKCVDKVSCVRALREEFRVMRRELKEAAPPSAKKPKTSKTRLAIPAKLELVEQKTIKPFCPPGTALWKSNRDASWHAQVRGWPGSISRSVNKYGEAGAIRALLTEAWYQHSILDGVNFEDVPVDGLLSLHELESL